MRTINAAEEMRLAVNCTSVLGKPGNGTRETNGSNAETHTRVPRTRRTAERRFERDVSDIDELPDPETLTRFFCRILPC
jgi:hypothetical protein